jgi:hypothetical protein
MSARVAPVLEIGRPLGSHFVSPKRPLFVPEHDGRDGDSHSRHSQGDLVNREVETLLARLERVI